MKSKRRTGSGCRRLLITMLIAVSIHCQAIRAQSTLSSGPTPSTMIDTDTMLTSPQAIAGPTIASLLATTPPPTTGEILCDRALKTCASEIVDLKAQASIALHQNAALLTQLAEAKPKLSPILFLLMGLSTGLLIGAALK